jgi:hypothetical protein
LAALYKAQGKTDLWLQTLETVLKEEDPGLDHAQVQVEIARGFMERKEWNKALPFAEEAAKTYAEWALRCASDCNEGLENWDKAEMYVRALSERYATSYYKWYYFCQRTGKGDVAAAERYVLAVFDAIGPRTTDQDRTRQAAVYVIGGHKQKSVEVCKLMHEQSPTQLTGFWLLAAYDEAGDKKGRDQLIQSFPTRVPALNQLVDLFKACLAKGEKAQLDTAAVDGLLKQLSPKGQAEGACHVARFLQQRGQLNAAREYYQRCASAAEATVPESQIIATARLRALGNKTGKQPANP